MCMCYIYAREREGLTTKVASGVYWLSVITIIEAESRSSSSFHVVGGRTGFLRGDYISIQLFFFGLRNWRESFLWGVKFIIGGWIFRNLKVFIGIFDIFILAHKRSVKSNEIWTSSIIFKFISSILEINQCLEAKFIYSNVYAIDVICKVKLVRISSFPSTRRSR